jgi:hypothetical protein
MLMEVPAAAAEVATAKAAHVPAAEAADLGASRSTVARVTEGHHSVGQLGPFDPGRRRTSPGRLEMGENGVAEVSPFYIIISFVY